MHDYVIDLGPEGGDEEDTGCLWYTGRDSECGARLHRDNFLKKNWPQVSDKMRSHKKPLIKRQYVLSIRGFVAKLSFFIKSRSQILF